MRHTTAMTLYLSLGCIVSGTWLVAGGIATAQSFENEPINYGKQAAEDVIVRLQKKLDAGTARLEFDKQHGYLPSLLQQLDVPQSTQMLVFSKTSFQQSRISPKAPRAVYFGDDVYVGWVQNGDMIEISSADAQQGAVFYTLKQRQTDRPQIVRQTHDCLQCHASSLTGGVPGHLVRSVYPDASGFPILGAGTFRTDHSSPLKQRWGGWYVTGQHGGQRHMGNVVVIDEDHPEQIDVAGGANVTDLSGRVDTAPYLTPHSDIAALMVLEHQTQMHNRITNANFETRQALFHNAIMNRMLERPEGELSESTERRVSRAAERLVEYLLFVDEAPLSGRIVGTSSFARDFAARGPADARGRTLRALDLQQRLFQYPCSYLIYSATFDGLPDLVRERVYRRLWEILTGSDSSEKFDHLADADRQAILEILRETKATLPDYWRADS